MSDDANDPHSEYGLEKEIRIVAAWFGSEEAETATMQILQEHCHQMKGLFRDLLEVRFENRKLRTDSKGKELDSPLARSWHR
jgi:hypothetical protein